MDTTAAEGGAPDLDIPDQIADQVHVLRHLYRSRMYAGTRDGQEELSHMAGRLLGHVGRQPGVTHTDLVAHFVRAKAQVTKLVKDLRARGLIEARTGKGDRRVQRLYRTELGEQVYDGIHDSRIAVVNQAVEGLDAGEQAYLLDLLRRVRGNLETGADCRVPRG